MKVLIILRSTPGEIIFSTVLIRALKVQLDDPQVYYLTTAEGEALLSDNPYLEKVTTNSRELRRIPFHYVFDLDATTRSRLLTLQLRGRTLRLNKRTWEKWLLTRFRINRMIPTHLADQFIDTGRALGLKNDGMRPDFTIPYKDDVPPAWLPEYVAKGFVIFCITASHETKKLPLKRMIELCDRINKPVVLIGRREDYGAGEAIEDFFRRNGNTLFEEGLRELNKKTIVYNACGKFNFNQQASLIRQSRYVFTFDNDFVAVASAFGKETFMIYGSTVTDFGSYPLQTRFTILENNRLSCRPCSGTGYKACPLKHFRCMNDIVFDFYLP